MSSNLPVGDEVRRYDYLAQHGKKLLANGYHIVPIRAGGKSPGFDGWEKSRATTGQLNEWLENGHKLDGVGILSKLTPAIDIDVRDEEVAQLLEDWIRKNLGGTLMRIGEAPKRLFVFRTDKPFRKMRTSHREDDEWMAKHQVEVLGEGQQFVAYAKHPDTLKPYYWTDEELSPLEVNANELPTLNEEKIQELFTYFETLADERGWKIKKKARNGQADVNMDHSIWSEDSRPVELSEEECRARMLLVPNPEDYDQWVTMGMACYHQWDGDEIGLKFWHEWSETAHNYDADGLDRRWEDFGIDGKKRAPITFRWVLKEANDAMDNAAEKLRLSLIDGFSAAKEMKQWEAIAKQVRVAEISGLVRSQMANVAKTALEKITGTKTSLIEVKKSLAFSVKNTDMPGWGEDWVYDVSDDKFFSTKKKLIVSKQGFDAMYDRYTLSKKDSLDGKTEATVSASELVLRTYHMQTIAGRRFEPGRDPIFHDDQGTFANTYSEAGIPDCPETVIPRDKKNVERVKRHIEHLLKDATEQRMFIDWISWVVQNPGQHMNYSILLQGVEGDGKSFWAELLREVMGPSNVQMLNAHIFESDFTDWVAGQCLSCVEEVRLVTHNKYEVINRIKPYITNRIVEVHPKGKAIINVRNTTSYLLFSNFKDALPLDDDGRRFLVLFSRWQRRSDLAVFIGQNPVYYEKLYAAIDESAGAIRAWLLDHEQSEDFNPRGNAPSTGARSFMVNQAKPEFILALNEVIKENEEVCADENLVDVTSLPPVLLSHGVEIPNAKTLASMLQRDGYESLGKVQVDGARSYFWSKNPEIFLTDNADDLGIVEYSPKKIREYVAKRKKALEDDEL